MTTEDKKRELALNRIQQVAPYLKLAENFIGAVKDYLQESKHI